MSRFRPTRFTKEERVAVRIGDLLSDFRLDLDKVGEYMATSNPYTIYRRFEEVAEAAMCERQDIEDTRKGLFYDSE
ncbi:hypothetical protein EB001_27660 [bacterium]|nr:hypothetical protein [bacterium]